MAQAAASDGEFLDLLPGLKDGGAAAEVDVDGSQVAEALVVAVVIWCSTKAATAASSWPGRK
jgi:hypothetical protein